MTSIQLNHVWPDELPLPLVDYSGDPRYATLVGNLADNARITRRRRFTTPYLTVSLTWCLEIPQFERFEEWYQNDLFNGAASFGIYLRYPRNSDLNEWQARFTGGYESLYQEGMWSVTAQLDLLRETALPDAAEPIGWELFLVEPTSSSADDGVFLTLGGGEFLTRTF